MRHLSVNFYHMITKENKMEASAQCNNSDKFQDNSSSTDSQSESDFKLELKKYNNFDERNLTRDYHQEMCENLEKLTPEEAGFGEISEASDMDLSPTTGEQLGINDILPEETWMTILLSCEVKDIVAFGITSKLAKKQFLDSNYFWKQKFFKLLGTKGYNLDDYKVRFTKLEHLRYREMCFRFAQIFDDDSEILSLCQKCHRFTCLQGCAEDHHETVSVDIGSKVTWLMTQTSDLKRHQSILSIRKVVKCVDCKAITKHRLLSLKGVCNCREKKRRKEQSDLRSNRFMYHSQDLNSGMLDTCCLFCKHRVFMRNAVESHIMRNYYEDAVEIGAGSTSPQLESLCSGFCADAASQMKLKSIDFASPALALRKGGEELGVATSFLHHVLAHGGVLDCLSRPHGVLAICENIFWPAQVRRDLLNFLFTRLKVSRVCLVPRPLAVCAELGLRTAVVVDSGAMHTAVSVVIGGQVILSRSREIPIGGRHIAESLHTAHACEDESQEIPVTSLDSSEVKEQCWLSYNLAAEESKQCTVRCESIWIPAPNRRNMRMKSWKQLSLGSEIYRAPECMYTQLGLPEVIIEVTKGLPADVLRECLSHIALTGGNTCLTNFELRLRRDLAKLLPEHEAILELVRGLGSRSCDAAVGATYIPFPMKQGVPPEPPEPGTPCWISRDDFIFYGTNHL